MKLNGLVNCGFCQGVANKSIIEIGDNVLRIDIDIEDNRKNPQSDKKRIYRVPFIAKDSVAEKINEAFADNFGDVILELSDDGEYRIIEDYLEEKSFDELLEMGLLKVLRNEECYQKENQCILRFLGYNATGQKD